MTEPQNNTPEKVRPNRGRTAKDYEALRFEAAVLYIKHGLSAKEITKRLKVSLPAVSDWRDKGRWNELRPDMELLTQYRAAKLYVMQGMSESDVSMAVNVSVITVRMWVYLHGWDAARLVNQAQDTIAEIVANFCSRFKSLFPNDAIAAQIEFVQNDYINKLTAKSYRHDKV